MAKLVNEVLQLRKELNAHQQQTDKMVGILIRALEEHSIVKVKHIDGGLTVEIIHPKPEPTKSIPKPPVS